MPKTNYSRFITSNYHELFKLPEGENIILHFPDGQEKTAKITLVNACHIMVDYTVYHICQYAEMCEQVGIIVRPSSAAAIEDGPDYYEIYQIPADSNCDYRFMRYSFAKEHGFSRKDYQCVYAGYLTEQDTLEGLFARHNVENRPAASQMHPLSVSDIVIIHKTLNGVKKYGMYYVDCFGFKELLAPRDGTFMC